MPALNNDEPVTIKKSEIVTPVLTSNPLFGDTDAVAEPEKIFDKSKFDNADNGISNNNLPLPL